MSAPTRPSTLVQGRAGRLLGAAVALSLIGTSLVFGAARAGRHLRQGPGRQLHHPRRRLRPRLGHVPVRRVRGGPQGSDLEEDPGLLLPRHQAEEDVQQHRAQGVGDRRLRRQRPGAAGQRPEGPRRRRRQLQGADRVEVQVLADQPVRVGIPAQLSQRQRVVRDQVDRAVQQHLEVLHRGPDRPGRDAQRLRPAVPGLGRAGQAGERRPYGQPGQAGELRQGRGGLGDAHLLASRGGGRPDRGRPVLRDPVARLHELRRLRHL